jgi:ribosomal protein L21E
MATYLATYRIGDIVDIVANAAEQKGMVSNTSLCRVPYERVVGD